MKLSLFASCAPGIEPWLAREIRELELGNVARESWPTNIVQDIGGVRFEGDQLTMAHALVGLGLAARLLVRIASFKVTELSDLDAYVGRLSWTGWLKRDMPRVIRATAKKSRLYHSGAIEQRVTQAITRRMKDDPPQADVEDVQHRPLLLCEWTMTSAQSLWTQVAIRCTSAVIDLIQLTHRCVKIWLGRLYWRLHGIESVRCSTQCAARERC